MAAGDPPSSQYEDFLVEFFPDGDEYRVTVRCGLDDRRSREPFALRAEDIEELVPRTELAVYGEKVDRTRASRMLGMEADEEDLVRVEEVGRELFEAVFDGPIRDFFRDCRRDYGSLRIRVKLDLGEPGQRALSRLPWEALRSPEGDELDFLAVDPGSPVVRDVAYEERVTPAPVEGKLRVLVITANPPGTSRLPGLVREGDVIAESFDELQRNGVLEYDHVENATLEAINARLRERSNYHVVHFMGHGDYRDGRGLLHLHGHDDEGAEVDAPVDSSDFALQLKGRTDGLRLVFLNACNTGVESRGESERQGVGVATSLLQAGIPAVIAMQYQMEDGAAVTFARTLYRQLAAFRPLEEAVSDARRDVLTGEGGSRRRTDFWLTPVLYMRAGMTSGTIFEQGGPVGLDPPESVDPEADYQVWLTEHGGRLVLNWRVRVTPGYEDFVALFPQRPDDDDPDGYLGRWHAPASEDGGPVEETRVLWTDVPADRGRYYIAYVRPDQASPIAAWDGPY